jgi:hypothetical protein
MIMLIFKSYFCHELKNEKDFATTEKKEGKKKIARNHKSLRTEQKAHIEIKSNETEMIANIILFRGNSDCAVFLCLFDEAFTVGRKEGKFNPAK